MHAGMYHLHHGNSPLNIIFQHNDSNIGNNPLNNKDDQSDRYHNTYINN